MSSKQANLDTQYFNSFSELSGKIESNELVHPKQPILKNDFIFVVVNELNKCIEGSFLLFYQRFLT